MKALSLHRLADWFLQYRYWLLGVAILALLSFRTDNMLWTGDFWEHSSVIRELATHPWHPVHPQLLSEAPHAFFTPYHLAIGLVVRWTNVHPVNTLAGAGIINLVLFLVSFYLFIPVVARDNRPALAFYGLLLILLFWGATVWNFSGFFHLRALAKILPFPSLFAMSLSMIALAMNHRRQRTGNNGWLVPIFLLTEIVLLTHAFTFIFLVTGLIVMAATAPNFWPAECLKLIGLLLLAVILGLLWPYYPLLQLILTGSDGYHQLNKVMYSGVFLRTWPLLIGVFLLLYAAIKQKFRQPVFWWVILLVLGYLFGWLSGAYSYGRLVSYAGVLLQLVIALYLTRLEATAAQRFRQPSWGAVLFTIGSSLSLFLISYMAFISPVVGSAVPLEDDRLERYYFLADQTGQYSVILTPIESSLVTPAFGGKVVSYDRPQPFVPNDAQRRSDVLQFFDSAATDAERSSILHRYSVDFILVDRFDIHNWEAIRPHLSALGELVYRSKRFFLYRVNDSGGQ